MRAVHTHVPTDIYFINCSKKSAHTSCSMDSVKDLFMLLSVTCMKMTKYYILNLDSRMFDAALLNFINLCINWIPVRELSLL